jgi:hypothetical protein
MRRTSTSARCWPPPKVFRHPERPVVTVALQKRWGVHTKIQIRPRWFSSAHSRQRMQSSPFTLGMALRQAEVGRGILLRVPAGALSALRSLPTHNTNELLFGQVTQRSHITRTLAFAAGPERFNFRLSHSQSYATEHISAVTEVQYLAFQRLKHRESAKISGSGISHSDCGKDCGSVSSPQ